MTGIRSNETLFRSLPHIRAALEDWRRLQPHHAPSLLGWMSLALYAAERRSATLRSAVTASQGI
jgi:hypothetical protein